MAGISTYGAPLNLEVALARPLGGTFGVARGLAFQFFHFLQHLLEAMPELVGFDFHSHPATLADEMGLGAFFKVAHQDRIFVTAFWTGDIDGLVFEHCSVLRPRWHQKA